jgi:hypothetical protein
VTFVGIFWVVVTPYCTGMVVAWVPPANRLVTAHLRVSTTVGWLAAATLCAGVFAVGGRPGMAIAIVSAPLVGLAFWIAASGPDEDDDRPADDDLPPVPDAIATKHVRLPGPRRSRPTGHGPAPRRRAPARTR